MSGLRWFQESARSFSGQLLFDEPLARHTYYRIGGPAAVMAIPRARADLDWLREGLRASGAPLFVLGAGSNILASDRGFPGLVVKANRVNSEIEPETDGVIRTGGSVAVSALLKRSALEGWAGLEFLAGVPGTMGGVVAMNAGTHLGEAAGALLAVEWVPLRDGEPREFGAASLKFQYRKNLFLPPEGLVWSARWRIRPSDPAKVKLTIDETLTRRKSTQPLDRPSCGSVFKNPKESGMSAWQVVDRLGLRGHRIGGAQFAERHSNFILNLGAANAADVRSLIELAKSRAARELGVKLEEEVMYVGDF